MNDTIAPTPNLSSNTNPSPTSSPVTSSTLPPFNHSSYSKNNDWWSEDTLVRFQNMNLEGGEPWRDVEANISKMDLLYDATFRSWLKDEENVVVVSSYLYRIANEYPLDRIVNAIKWLVSSWSVESVSIIIKHITSDWNNFKQNTYYKHSNLQLKKHQKMIEGETKRGFLIREITRDWPCIQVAKLVSNLSTVFWSSRVYQEHFLKALVLDWDFCHLSEFFSYVGSQLGLDYRLKVSMLQLSAKRNHSPKSKDSLPENCTNGFKNVQKRLIHDVETDATKRARISPDIPCIDININLELSRGINIEQNNNTSSATQNIHYISSDQSQDLTRGRMSSVDQSRDQDLTRGRISSADHSGSLNIPHPASQLLPLSPSQDVGSSLVYIQQQHEHQDQQLVIAHEVSNIRPSTSSNNLSMG
ncbi:hypothetical protein BB561_005502 [Smittium simulii]|uniref:Uncharacterized protein n=1 Tax=Smittium simulii TaxID=133385 RepID=A0A2T9YA41_9FUNG|nr:hypothetical protein BB561_005502 [Smittium simulii]